MDQAAVEADPQSIVQEPQQMMESQAKIDQVVLQHEVPARKPGKNKAGRKRRRDFDKYDREECKKKAEESFIEK